MNCVNCTTQTKNPRFCSRSCAAAFNNRIHPKRRPEGKCADCGEPLITRKKRCDPCAAAHRLNKVMKRRIRVDLTLNSNKAPGRMVRWYARSVYINAGRPMKCALCGYDKHVDICHIVDIRLHPHGTTADIVNAQSNLLALCRNHHWEFDHDML